VRRLAAALLLACAIVAAPAHASMQQESTFQDDDLLVFGSADTQAKTLDELKSLGVDRIRASLFWNSVAPDPKSKTKPSGFDASDPAAYPADNWAKYDRLITGAQARGIAINLDPTGPAPLWATGKPDRADIEGWYQPSPDEFGAFVAAAAKRYSGSYTPPPPPQPAPPPSNNNGGGGVPIPPPPARAAQSGGSGALPRVDYWAIWNEPNQSGWLAPQWVQAGGRWNEAAPSLYRGLVDAAYSALQANGHGGDTILVGETAPKGLVTLRGETRSIDALRFLRALYCVSSKYKPLTGDAATRIGCPADPSGFAAAHPGLFSATGWAHHPYELLAKPQQVPKHRDWVTIANLPHLTGALNAVLRAYGKSRTGGLPLYLTEYGYQTNPPDKFGVSFNQQAAYLDESEFITYTNPNVRTLSQFLLHDGGGDVGVTFQSGLETNDGTRKPSYQAYALPVYLPKRSFRRTQRLRVWGLARPAPNGSAQKVAVQFKAKRGKKWRTVRTLKSVGTGYVDGRVKMPGTGSVRLQWGGLTSRTVSVKRR